MERKFIMIVLSFLLFKISVAQPGLVLNDMEYFESPGFDVLVFNDPYTEGHQGGIQIILHGQRIAANGDVRLEPAPGQWQPFSKMDSKTADKDLQQIKVSLSYPNEEAASRKFNPISYPDLEFGYHISVRPEGKSVRIIIDLDKPLPDKWVGRVGFSLELFPGTLYGKKFYMDKTPGIFPLQLSGPFSYEKSAGTFEVVPLASGNRLEVCPEDKLQHFTIQSQGAGLQLIDGSAHHNNGWFIVRSLVPKGTRNKVIEWVITPSVVNSWSYGPVIHINQAGYLSGQPKKALIECDARFRGKPFIRLIRIENDGTEKLVRADSAESRGKFERFRYFAFDFSDLKEEGIYRIRTDSTCSESFLISQNVYDRGVWQPTLEYFLPVQMCHMRVNDRYRLWHGLCHMDDAQMAPVDYVHFDGYQQGNSTLCSYQSGDHVPGLNTGGWHDAGDFDLRVESQGGTVYSLSLIWEAFRPDYDNTTIDPEKHLVEMHLPDGKPDILQQIEHGTLAIVNAYESIGSSYRGVICRDLRQYVLMGDGAGITDNIIFGEGDDIPDWFGKINDDRWVFTEENPKREFQLCADLAAASRSLKEFNDSLSARALAVAEQLWQKNADREADNEKVIALTELILATGDNDYLIRLAGLHGYVAQHVPQTGWAIARVFGKIEEMQFRRGFMLGIQNYYRELENETSSNPFGVPYHPQTWGSAWGIERFGVGQYFIYHFLEIEEARFYMANALDYVLGIHPGENTASFVSGVGTHSATVAYGLNRADWSYIPGGVISGTANIQPDFPELKEWPYLWQQTEYMISGASENFMFLVLAVSDAFR
jgi:endoglucanase